MELQAGEPQMLIELTAGDISVLLESLKYSKQRVSDAPGTPYDVRQDKLSQFDDVAQKLRDAPRG